MRRTLLILRYRLRSHRRRLRANAFPVFFLGPVILGGLLWIGERYLDLVRGPLGSYLASGHGEIPGAVGLAAALVVTVSLMPSTLREVFAQRTATAYLDALPLGEGVRFHVALGVCTARNAPAWGLLLLAAVALTEEVSSAAVLWALRLLAALFTLAILQMLVAQIRVRLRLLSSWSVLAVGLALAVAAGSGIPALRLLVLPWWAAAAQIETVLGQALAVPQRASAPAEPWFLAATVAVLYLLSGWLHLRWHRRDLEVAWVVMRSPARRWHALFERLADGRLGSKRAGPLTAQLVRDVLLVVRRFSPAVHLAVVSALATELLVLLVLPAVAPDPLWLRRFALAGCVVAILSMVALVPLVLKHELPRFWIEKSSGVELAQIARTKLWLARLLALPTWVAGTAVLVALPSGSTAEVGISILQLAASAWIVASTIGLAAFEIAAQPLLGLAFSSLIALALAALMIFYPQGWWLWAIFYVVVAGKLSERTTRRVRFTEVET
ncbi:MAG: hypothetical protein GY856_20095 [bacterium]|nr:hypothetical protein [bacterium]